MSDAWKTKYGPRRVRRDPPTLEEAIFAAKGITDNLQGQIEIAASLMGLPEDNVRAEVIKSGASSTRMTQFTSISRGSMRTVVVERRAPRRALADRRVGS